MIKKWLPHSFAAVALAVFIVFGLASASTPEPSSESISNTDETVGNFTPQYWTGDGGKGMSIAILAPKATGLAENQSYLPALVQGEFVSNFSGFSAISILDRQRLDEVYAEQLSGYYNDDAGLDLGHLKETDYIQTGSITKTATGYALQIQITRTADKMTAASYSGTFTFAELDNLTGIRRASLDLLQKMGVTLTAKAKEELAGAAAANQVTAQTALARGITAQRQGTEVAALSFYFEAAAYDPSLLEAVSRSSVLNANITSGNIGDNIRNDIQWRRDWVARLTETEQFLDSFNKTESMPYTLYYTNDIKQVGQTDYKNETVTMGGIETHLHGSGIWTLSIERALQAVYDGLDATGRRSTWQLANWPQQGVTNLNFTGRSQNFTVVFELLNNQNKVIGRQTLQTGGSWGLSRSGRPAVNVNADDRKTLNFQNVNANDITDSMTIRAVTVNGTDAGTAARNRVLQIRAITKNRFDSNAEYRFAKGELQGFVKKPELKQGHVYSFNIPDTIWGDPVISIGRQAFNNMSLYEINIPNSVISIGSEAFANNSLTIVKGGNGVASIGAKAFKNAFGSNTQLTIPNSVTSIGEEAFSQHYTDIDKKKSIAGITIGANMVIAQNTFLNSWRYYNDGKLYEGVNDGFYEIYNRNNKKAGTYKDDIFMSWRYNAPPSFPSNFMGTWKRDRFNNTLTFTTNTLKADNQLYAWNLTNVSPGPNGSNIYTISSATNITYWVTDTAPNKLTIQLSSGTLKISGDKGSGEDNWNGTWKKQ